MISDRIDEPEADPPVEEPVVTDAPLDSKIAALTAELIATREMLAVAHARLSQLERPADWKPLKVAAFVTGQKYETVRRWSRSGKIISQNSEGRVLCDVGSIRARLTRLRSV
jgi:hypothetical protein